MQRILYESFAKVIHLTCLSFQNRHWSAKMSDRNDSMILKQTNKANGKLLWTLPCGNISSERVSHRMVGMKYTHTNRENFSFGLCYSEPSDKTTNQVKTLLTSGC